MSNKLNEYGTPMQICPACGSDDVVSENHQMWYVNKLEHYCQKMKNNDPESPTTCLVCDWTGLLNQLGVNP